MRARAVKDRRPRKERSLCDLSRIVWLGWEGSNLRMAESKSAALPLGYIPMPIAPQRARARRGRTIVSGTRRRNGRTASAAKGQQLRDTRNAPR
jgi:hypothetical protein